jgi:BirA family biotin operon repressor/biotin-[acetyl-CoA-carboxylase] ligase
MARIIEKLETGSTNDDAKAYAETGAEHFTVVWAHRQTAGRGRHQRRWESRPGNVFWSVVLRPRTDWPPVGQLVHVHALAVLRTVRGALGTGGELGLKWPNDLLLNDGKVAGSLLEAGGPFTAGRPAWVVIGTGINVVSHPGTGQAPPMRYPATSLHDQGFQQVERQVLLEALAPALSAQLERWVRDGFEPIRQEYLEHAHGLGQLVRVGGDDSRREPVEGIYRGIAPSGAMLLERADGGVEVVSSGDVIHRA